MPRRVQILRGNASEMNDFLGFEGELTAVLDAKELRLHDGTTIGGLRIFTLELNDDRYQRRDTELTALTELGNTRGFLVRTGVATYLTRQIVGSTDEVDVANGTGFEGDIVISLPTTIDKVGLQFQQVTTFVSGIIGDVVGNLTGNVTGNLTGNANGNHTGSFTGDVDVRGQTLQLDDGQIARSKIVGGNDLLDNTSPGIIPEGGIILWSGIVANIPSGFFLCDGNNNTPDLRDRFVIGGSSTGSFAPGANGGAQTHTHAATTSSAGSHSHSITVNAHTLTINEIPSHFHGTGIGINDADVAVYGLFAGTSGGVMEDDNQAAPAQTQTQTVGGGGSHNHGASSSAAGAHTHPVNVPAANHLPPYYALAYIMRAFSV